MKVLVTGGAGYIGSHTVLSLLTAGHEVTVVDNLANSSPEALRRVETLAGRSLASVEADIRDGRALSAVMEQSRPDAVVHFAGLKAVGESTEKPLEYYANNVFGTVALLKAMEAVGCRRIVFSSSATVYGEAQYLPFDEAHPLGATNPYGRTKHFVEEIIADWTASVDGAGAALLRYFNPVGAHASGRIGEDPSGIPNNLAPYITRVAVGSLASLSVFGGDYDTRDGTGERDYVHVEDLAEAHLAALEHLGGATGCHPFNIGTGRTTTVLEMVRAFEAASGRTIPHEIMPRRAGDVACSYAAVDKAAAVLNWRATRDLADMCASAWRWQSQNPAGYADASG
ncbi:MAG: UDP-glucose 4-epimerase GalE [Pseudomonadota bacterium]